MGKGAAAVAGSARDAADDAADDAARQPGTKQAGTKPVALALQGGGAHGAFTWGVLDALLADGRVRIEAISGTSAGAMNAAAVAQGLLRNGPDGARAALDTFWGRVSDYAYLSPIRRTPLQRWLGQWNVDLSPGYLWTEAVETLFAPAQVNPLGYNPLRPILEETIDPAAVRASPEPDLFICATHVPTGKLKVFRRNEFSIDALLASSCLPQLFPTVEIGGEPYWDGGYMGNPSVIPLLQDAATSDVVLVQVNPFRRDEVPRTPVQITNRLNEIAFNSALRHELQAVAFIGKLLEAGHISPLPVGGYLVRPIRLHRIAAEDQMRALGVGSKLNTERDFLLHLRQIGHQAATAWLESTFDALGQRATYEPDSVVLEDGATSAPSGPGRPG